MNLSSIPTDHINDLIAKQILNLYSKEFLAELKKLKKTNDAEAIHQVRVYSRRLKATFDFFSDALPSIKKEEWNKEIKRFLSALNKPRDIQVQLDYIKILAGKNDFQNIIEVITQYLNKQQHKQEKKITKALKRIDDSKVFPKILRYCKKSNKKANKFLSPSNYEIIALVCSEKMVPLLNQFNQYKSYLFNPERVEELHKSRLLIKNIRYTIEILKPIFPSLNSYLKIAVNFQTLLGEIHDCDVWFVFLEDFSMHLNKKKIHFSEDDYAKLIEELDKLRTLRASERELKFEEVIKILDQEQIVHFEKDLLNSFKTRQFISKN
ncbi:MAG: CHAD domain-containing protein [Bacteroidota bacterium]